MRTSSVRRLAAPALLLRELVITGTHALVTVEGLRIAGGSATGALTPGCAATWMSLRGPTAWAMTSART